MPLSEAERAEGYFLVPFADGEVRLPGLSWESSSQWALESARAFGPAFEAFERDWKPGDGLLPVETANQAAMEVMVERIVSYDIDGVLGGIAHIRQLRPPQIRDLYGNLYEYSHPFDADLQAALVQMATMRVNAVLAAQLAGASSTNGSSPSGASRRERRARSSPPARSTSSGSGPRTAGSASSRMPFEPPLSAFATQSPSPTSPPASGRRGAT